MAEIGHIAFFLRFDYANELSDIIAHVRIVRESAKLRENKFKL